MTKAEVLQMIDEMSTKLKKDLEVVEGERSSRADIVRMTVPVHLEHLRILRIAVQLIKE